MLTTASSPTVSRRRLEWDSAHFGVAVAELPSPDLNDEDLRRALTTARAEGLQLVYWAAQRERTLPADLLHEFHGLAVNHRVKFVAPLISEAVSSESFNRTPQARAFPDAVSPELLDCTQQARAFGDAHACGLRLNDGMASLYRIGEFPRGPAPRGLLELAIVAGGHSRFQVDPRIPADRFRTLYETWMNRSTLHELADVVLVATPADAPLDYVGTITLSETAGSGQIGLLAVREDHRGQGVATRLMTAAHDWLRQRGATEMSVVTQLENREACGLYSRWNCAEAEVRQWFHFWPQSPDEGK